MSVRLSHAQINFIRSLAQFGGGGLKPVTVSRQLRTSALPLWRRGLIEIWCRQGSSEYPLLPVPYYSLSPAGRALAQHFFTPDKKAAARPARPPISNPPAGEGHEVRYSQSP